MGKSLDKLRGASCQIKNRRYLLTLLIVLLVHVFQAKIVKKVRVDKNFAAKDLLLRNIFALSNFDDFKQKYTYPSTFKVTNEKEEIQDFFSKNSSLYTWRNLQD